MTPFHLVNLGLFMCLLKAHAHLFHSYIFCLSELSFVSLTAAASVARQQLTPTYAYKYSYHNNIVNEWTIYIYIYNEKTSLLDH